MKQNVLAYLDAGSGSMILQVLAGGFAALAVSAKLWWHRVARLFRFRRDDEQQQAAAPASSSDTPS
jgi:hypothetical protein